MLAILALAMLATFMILIMSGRASTLVALILPPIGFALLGGFGPQLGPLILQGVERLAPTGVMLTFAIWYFCLMSDAGLFDPLIRLIVRLVRHDPARIVTGTAILALTVSLDGDGSTTYLICCSALLPLYRRMKLDPLILACVLTLSCGITNITPWGGPTAVLAGALNVDPVEIFLPLVPAMLMGALFVIGLSYGLGRRERRRLGLLSEPGRAPESLDEASFDHKLSQENADTRRPGLFLFNLALTLALMTSLVLGVLPLPALFIIATAVALIVNYRSLESQKERLSAHAPNIMRVVAVVFAAGVFVGILDGTGMATALGQTVAQAVPPALGPHFAPVTGLLSIPFTFVIPNKGLMLSIVPVLSETAAHYGAAPLEIARAALLSQAVHLLSPAVPSTYLLVALAGVDFGKHQRFTILWAVIVSLVMLAVAVLTGAIPFTH